MDVSISISWIYEIISKKFFYRTYLKSHLKYLEELYDISWIEVNHYNFYMKLHLENIKKNDINETSFFSIKSFSENKLENVLIKIEAESIFEKYTENIFIDKLDIKTQKFILNRIPFQEIAYYKNYPIRNYHSLKIELIKANDLKINQIIYKIQPDFSPLVEVDDWQKKWGKNWNIRYIQRGKQEIRDYLYEKIAGTNIEKYHDIYKMHYIHPIKFIKSFSYVFARNSIIINILFWIFIWSNKLVENETGDLYI